MQENSSPYFLFQNLKILFFSQTYFLTFIFNLVVYFSHNNCFLQIFQVDHQNRRRTGKVLENDQRQLGGRCKEIVIYKLILLYLESYIYA
jgi:hypothetical protein